jgi:hypothetical protein
MPKRFPAEFKRDVVPSPAEGRAPRGGGSQLRHWHLSVCADCVSCIGEHDHATYEVTVKRVSVKDRLR